MIRKRCASFPDCDMVKGIYQSQVVIIIIAILDSGTRLVRVSRDNCAIWVAQDLFIILEMEQ